VWADLGFPGHLNYDINRSASGNPFARLPDFKATIKGKLKINARAQLDYQEAIVQSKIPSLLGMRHLSGLQLFSRRIPCRPRQDSRPKEEEETS
jgi:hypothetical protein